MRMKNRTKIIAKDKELALIRAKNLGRVVYGDDKRRGKITEFCDKHSRYEVNASYISNVLTGKKIMGEKVARKFEQMLGLPHSYFDVDHDLHGEELTPAMLSVTETRLLELFSQAPEEVQRAILQALRPLSDQ